MFWSKDEEIKHKEQINVQKAIATVNMREGMSRTITRIGATLSGFPSITGKQILEKYLNTSNTLLLDDNHRYFPVNNIRDIEIKVEDFFIDNPN